MNLLDLIQRASPQVPWKEGDKIPWNEPGFSARMLKEHLSQSHDWASRRTEKIDRQVAWIHRLAGEQPMRVLDLGCGPGLYTHRLALLGHDCVGIDFSPASIAYAAAFAADQPRQIHQRLSYILDDIRWAEFGQGFDLVMLIYGEFNTFRPVEAGRILEKAFAALAPGGRILLEPHTFAAVREMGTASRSWYSSRNGLFSDRPHLCLIEACWDEPGQAAFERYYVIDAERAAVTPFGSTTQAYTDEQYFQALAGCGFEQIAIIPSLVGEIDPDQPGLFVLTACKPVGAGA